MFGDFPISCIYKTYVDTFLVLNEKSSKDMEKFEKIFKKDEFQGLEYEVMLGI